MVDLAHALERVAADDWERARDIAAELDATASFAAGLRLLPEGEVLSERLGVADARSVDTILRTGTVPLAEGLNELLKIPGALAKVRVAFGEVFPRPGFMRWWSPLARRGRRGLAAAYVWRPVYLLLRLPAAVAAWKAARRDASR
jgi:hypothetical protein